MKKTKAEPIEQKGKWVRFDRKTVIFVKDGQDAEAVLKKYRERELTAKFVDMIVDYF